MDNTTAKNKLTPIIVGTALLLVGAGAVVWVVASGSSKTNSSDTSSTSSQTTSTISPTSASSNSNTTATTTTSSSSSTYKDGTYSVTGTYFTPAGNESIKMDLTLANGNITNVVVTPQGKDPETVEHQERFESGISGKVIGKTLDSAANISTVNGSSLTTNFFKQTVVSQVKSQAQG